MRVKEIMRPIVRIGGDVPITEAAKVMEEKQLNAILVEHRQGLGIFTEHDILRKVVAQGLDPKTTPVSTIINTPPITIESSMAIEDASELMKHHNIRRLVVTERGLMVGLVDVSMIANNMKYVIARRLVESTR